MNIISYSNGAVTRSAYLTLIFTTHHKTVNFANSYNYNHAGCCRTCPLADQHVYSDGQKNQIHFEYSGGHPPDILATQSVWFIKQCQSLTRRSVHPNLFHQISLIPK